MVRREIVLTLLLGIFCPAPSSAQSLDLTGIAHVAFRVANYEESRAFYARLGFAQAFQTADPGKPRVSFVKINDQQFLELYEKSGDSSPGFMHICFETSDIESLRNAYLKLGLSPTEVKKFRAGNLLFVVHDSGGQLVEYTQYLPGSLHFLDRGQHLGARRISERLLASSTPAPNPAAEHDYYSRLGFQTLDSSRRLLGLAGKSGQQIELLTETEARPKIRFAVDNLKRAQKSLRQRKIKFEKHGDSLDITDPDGTTITFAAR